MSLRGHIFGDSGRLKTTWTFVRTETRPKGLLLPSYVKE
ncbi:hypothetical protein PspLS_04609 [Pyricularia sp. CBS 133598]|nr:hypothetical protein PspLS_04609 [Pyricularia sp. CBS 133598]